MSYPTCDLKDNFQDINADNADIVGRYIMLSWRAISKTPDDILQKIPTFNDVSQYYTSNEDVLKPVIFNAETVNSIIKYLKELKNYTISTKNQLFFISESDLNSTTFDDLDNALVDGDIIAVTNNESRRVIKRFEQKQVDGTYQVVGTIPSNDKYVECSQVVSSTAYLTSSNSNILHGDGSDIFIRFMNVSLDSNSQLYLNINGQPYNNIVFRGNPILWKDIRKNYTYHFVLNYNHNEDGDLESRLEMISYLDKEIDTGWVDCEYASTVQSITGNRIPYFVPYNGVSSNRVKVRRIGEQVYLQGVLTNVIGVDNTKTYEQSFIIPAVCRPSRAISLVMQLGSYGRTFCLNILPNGNVKINNFSGDISTGASKYPGAYTNLEATPIEGYYSGENGEMLSCFGSWLVN